jgi:hypothetical protein
VRVGVEDSGGRVPEPSGDDMDRHTAGQRQRRMRVPQGVQSASRDISRRAMPAEPFSEPLRVNRPAELIAENRRRTFNSYAVSTTG